MSFAALLAVSSGAGEAGIDWPSPDCDWAIAGGAKATAMAVAAAAAYNPARIPIRVS
jgi:hypothetical protein